jgi:hypothetical protein
MGMDHDRLSEGCRAGLSRLEKQVTRELHNRELRGIEGMKAAQDSLLEGSTGPVNDRR